MINGFTPTEKKIMNLLSDGRPHKRTEVKECLPDELAELKAVKTHISRIRPKINGVGEEIVCRVLQGTFYYQHVRLLPSGNDGRS